MWPDIQWSKLYYPGVNEVLWCVVGVVPYMDMYVNADKYYISLLNLISSINAIVRNIYYMRLPMANGFREGAQQM